MKCSLAARSSLFALSLSFLFWASCIISPRHPSYTIHALILGTGMGFVCFLIMSPLSLSLVLDYGLDLGLNNLLTFLSFFTPYHCFLSLPFVAPVVRPLLSPLFADLVFLLSHHYSLAINMACWIGTIPCLSLLHSPSSSCHERTPL